MLKGDARMAEVLRRALWGGIAQARPTRSQVPLAGRRYRISAGAAQALRRRPAPGGGDDDQLLRTTPPAGSGWRMRLAEDARRQKEDGRRQPDRRRDRAGPPGSAEVRAFLRRGLAGPATRAGLLVRAAHRPGPAGPAPPAGCSTTTSRQLLRWAAAPRSVRTAPWTRGRRGPGRRGRRPARAHARATGTWWSTRRRTSRRCSAARSPAGCAARLAHRARRPGPGAPARGRPSDWRDTLAGLGRPDAGRPPADQRLPGARRGARLRQPAAAAHRRRGCRRRPRCGSDPGAPARPRRWRSSPAPLAEVGGRRWRPRRARSA